MKKVTEMEVEVEDLREVSTERALQIAAEEGLTLQPSIRSGTSKSGYRCVVPAPSGRRWQVRPKTVTLKGSFKGSFFCAAAAAVAYARGVALLEMVKPRLKSAQQVENALVQLLYSSDTPVSSLLPGWRPKQIMLGNTLFWEEYAEKAVERKAWTYLLKGESVSEGSKRWLEENVHGKSEQELCHLLATTRATHDPTTAGFTAELLIPIVVSGQEGVREAFQVGQTEGSGAIPPDPPIPTISSRADSGAYDAVIAFDKGYAQAFAAQHPSAKCPLRFHSVSQGCHDEDAGEAARWRASLRPEAATRLVEVRAEGKTFSGGVLSPPPNATNRRHKQVPTAAPSPPPSPLTSSISPEPGAH
eukprot:Transcript_14626.p1 GENE.Transcript_14626~~Transcript_14626.p1  ORF type:complete len:366 (+),score=57.50 Transcript_14626:24-1100(+)